MNRKCYACHRTIPEPGRRARIARQSAAVLAGLFILGSLPFVVEYAAQHFLVFGPIGAVAAFLIIRDLFRGDI